MIVVQGPAAHGACKARPWIRSGLGAAFGFPAASSGQSATVLLAPPSGTPAPVAGTAHQARLSRGAPEVPRRGQLQVLLCFFFTGVESLGRPTFCILLKLVS